MSSFFPSPFLLGQTDVSPTRCWGKNLLLFTDTSAHFEAINKFAQVSQQKYSNRLIENTHVAGVWAKNIPEWNIRLQRKVLSNLWCLQKNGIGDWGLAWVLELEIGNTHFALVTVTFSQFQNIKSWIRKYFQEMFWELLPVSVFFWQSYFITKAF